VVYNADYVPDRCCRKVHEVLGARAKGLRGERGLNMGAHNGFANRGLHIPYQKGLISMVRREKPDVLISDGFFQWTYAALWLRATRGIPHVMCYERTAHTERHAQWYRSRYRKAVMRWIDAMCCNGKLCGEYVRSMGFPADRISYGHMVADVEGMRQAVSGVREGQILALREEYGLKGVVFLYMGRLSPRKGIRQLLEAWRAAFGGRRQGQETLLLVGDGPQRRELERYCAENELSGVRFAGAVDYDALSPFYRSADAFVIPTLEDNWSLVVPEAMACGLPVLCSKYNGCWPELVKPENGWVFDPLDVQATAAALKTCLDNHSKLDEMGACSRRIVAEHTAEHAARAVLEACEIALGTRATGASASEAHLP
jgi:glycosyltransferase involved in cell wall biosynthesis